MDDHGIFDRIFSAAAGVWAMVAMVSVALFKAWPGIMARINERQRDLASEKAGDWERIRSERDVAREERDLVRDRWAQCEAEKTELMQENATLRGILQGIGEWREAQALREAGKRLAGRSDGPLGGGK